MPSLYLPASLVAGWLVTELGIAVASRSLKRAGDRPWYERARLLFPVRTTPKFNWLVLFVVVIECVVIMKASAPGPWRELAKDAAVGCLAGMIGVWFAGRRLEAKVCRTREGRPRTGVPLSFLMVWPTVIPFLLMAVFIPGRVGWDAVAVLIVGAAFITFQVCGGWVIVLRRLGVARPASPRVQAVVDRAAFNSGIRPRRTLELNSPVANALAFPVSGVLIFTTPALDVFDDDELQAVTAHELGHLAESGVVRLSRALAPYLLVGVVAGIPIGGSFGVWAGLAPLAFLVAGSLAMGAVGRRMEDRSDRFGRDHEGIAEGVYARALEKIYETNMIPVVLRGRPVHPHLYDRLTAAGRPPDYPRPASPPRALLARATLVILLACVLGPPVFGRVGTPPAQRQTSDAPSLD